jgi:GTP cyclohydrolase II
MIIRIAEGTLETKFGPFKEILYYDGLSESIALVKGDIESKRDVLCRVHSHCISAHIFNSIECDCREQMELAQFFIEQKNEGIIIWLNQEGRGNGHMALVQSAKLRYEGMSQSDAYLKLGYEVDARSFKRAAEILEDLRTESVCLLTNNPKKIGGLQEVGINITSTKPLSIDVKDNKHLQQTYQDKLNRGHTIPIK